jgi:hypothetical protein
MEKRKKRKKRIYPAKVQGEHISYQLASPLCVLISTDNLLRWVERGEKSYWFWLCSGRIAMVVLFGALALVAQIVYWAELVRGLRPATLKVAGMEPSWSENCGSDEFFDDTGRLVYIGSEASPSFDAES